MALQTTQGSSVWLRYPVPGILSVPDKDAIRMLAQNQEDMAQALAGAVVGGVGGTLGTNAGGSDDLAFFLWDP